MPMVQEIQGIAVMDIDQIVDVVIPVYHPGKEFEELMTRLDRQTIPVHKVYIMHTEDGSELSFEKVHDLDIVVETLPREEYDHGGTRDRAMQKSDADIVICMTQDAVPEDDRLVERLIRPLMTKEAAVSYARQMPRTECRLIERYVRGFNYPNASRLKSRKDLDTLGIKTYFCSNVCAAYDREIYQRLGGFEKRTIFNEDMIYAAKCIHEGFCIAYEAEAKVVHSHNYSRREQFSRNFDIAVSQSEHPEIFQNVKSEKEGVKMVKKGIRFLIHNHTPWMVPSLIFDSAAKYLGYLFGKNYKRMPLRMVKFFSMNPGYWEGKRPD